MMQDGALSLGASAQMLDRTMRLLVCAGGTGGGIYPGLAAVSELEARGLERDQIMWVGTRGEMEEQLVPEAGIRLETIEGGAVVGVPLRESIPNAARLAWSIGKGLRLVRAFKPDVMFMTGGYMAAPIAAASWLQRVPIGIYLPDVEPGASIRYSVPLAKGIAATTDGSAAFVPIEKMTVTGYPVRPELRAAARLTKEKALAQFDLTAARQTLFVFGGSRGAQNINRALMAILPELLTRLQVIHISGTLTWPEVQSNLDTLTSAQRDWYRAYPYLHKRMGAAFRAADLVVARAGASMLGEAPAFGLPSVLVPLSFAWRYQKVNADFLTERGAAVQLTDESLAQQLLPTVIGLLNDEERLVHMGRAAKALDKPQATANLAEFIVNLAKEGRS
ncbi:MAG: UDP-N-acetylglucosamine--N-acetylmuramyl-(pentapeptide) pyrophosphoryl-undecaprenol N-acetylglucosamine transferase [Candidatus Promineifilaceae bacterium]